MCNYDIFIASIFNFFSNKILVGLKLDLSTAASEETKEMDFKESERYYHGYVFLPCCTKECYQNQPRKLQEYTSLYPSLIPKNEAFLPDRANSVDQVPHRLRFTAYREGGYRFIFPATQKDQTQPCEISRHGVIDAEGPLRTSYKAGKYISQSRKNHWYRPALGNAVCGGLRNSLGTLLFRWYNTFLNSLRFQLSGSLSLF